jgi:ribonucleoside-diphosphate reductase alpha chain
MLEKRDPKALQIQAGNQRMINLAFKIINKGGNIDTFENYCKSRKELIGDYGISKKKLKERFIKRFGSYESFVKEVRSQNHKVVAINPIGKSTVYDVEVFCTTPDDKTAKSGHNFIIWPDDNPTGSGIVVFNTRRAAKLVCLDIDHPDVEDFITCKAREEERVHALRAAGFEMGMSGIGERNMAEATAYQNANNSVRVTDQFMQAVLDDKEWQLIGRKDGKPVRTVQAKELMNLVADAAWRCADPGIQYDTTINDWHTTPANGPITGSNPCCFTGDTQVVTLEGRFTFEQLISRTYIGDHELPEVVGVDPQGKQVTQRIEKVWKAGETDKLVLVSTVRGTNLRCTPEHKFLNSDGDYVAAENLIRGDELVALQGNDQVASITKINLEQPVSVYDLEAPVTNNFPVAGANDQEAVIVHNSEYMSNDNTACNLASINLLKFLNEDGTFDTERFEHVTSIIFLAQEITISFADFPTPKIAKNTQALRQIGIGYTNLGALLMALAHPYDSDPGREIAGGVTALLTGQAYLTSAKIAAKIGPFADYEANKESTLRVLNKHRKEANKLDSESYGTGVGKAAKAAWKKALADAKEYGVRNAQASVAAPTGCLIPSTLVATDRGLIRLGGLGDKHGDQWQDVDFQVQTDQGPKQATKFFINGEVEVARVKTKNGYEILGTPEHQIKIIDQNGDWVWTKIADVQAGSKLPIMLNNLIGNPREVDLSQITLSAEHGERRDNSIPMVQPPKAVTADLSELVGFYYGSQSNYLGSRVNILVDAQDQQLQTKISALIESLFSDRPVSTECFHDPSKIELSVPGQWADKWWREAGFNNLRISPAKIRRTNNQEIYAAFLRGFWQAGRVDKIGLVVKTEEKELANDIRSMMLTVGIPTSTVLNDQNGKPEYEIRPLDAAVGKFTEKIGALTETRINNLKEIATLQKTSFGVEDFFEDEIVSAELAYKSETYDLSVPENVTYVANGIVSHNTISFLMDADTTGIEPDFSLIKHKTLAGGGSLQIVNRTVPEALRRMGLNQKQIDESIAYIEEEITREDGSQGPRGHLHGAKHVTENQARVFDCAVGEHAIDYHAHLKMMAAAQPFLSGAISKTVNLPADATVEDIAETYIEGWRLGLKSVAIYRDGSKANQPLAEKKADRDEEAQAAAEARVTSLLGDGLLRGERRRVPRDAEIKGVNFNIGPVGGYVHVRLFEDGTPGAVFVEVGQAGSTLNGFISVWAITMSLGLQYGLPLDKLASKLAWTQFEPQGFTDDPEIRSAKSIVDYVIRWMANEFLDLDDISREALGLGIQSKEADTGEHTIIPGGEIEPKAEVKAPVKPAEKHKVSIQRIGGHCSRCGSTDLFPTGSCMTCRSCGETSGCG